MNDDATSREADLVREYPVDGTLDLHTFSPGDVRSLVPEYLRVCWEREFYEVRIIHGKGTGKLRRLVHAILDRLAIVEGYTLAQGHSGGWGATIVRLRSPGVTIE